MRRPPLALAVLVLSALALMSCGGEPSGDGFSAGGTEVAMTDAQGNDVGTVTLSPSDLGVRVEARLEGLDTGFHGFHIHEIGRCEANAPDGAFTTAGGHYVGQGGNHGDHDGDMPSLYVTEDGLARLTVELDSFTIDELAEGDGATVIVHADADNFANIPDRYTSSDSGLPGPDEMTNSTGDSGARAACGVVTAASGA